MFDFLKQIQLKEELEGSLKTLRKSELNPDATTLRLRVWSDGSVHPSAKLVQDYKLQFAKAVVTPLPPLQTTNENGETVMIPQRDLAIPEGTYGLDIFSISDWTQADEVTRSNPALLMAVSPKTSPKIDLFGSTKYDDQGNPKGNVMNQSTAFGKRLIELLKAVYNVNLDKGAYVDLEVVTDINFKTFSSNGIFMLPKIISRGDEVGKPSYVRRENIDIFPLKVVSEEQESMPNSGSTLVVENAE